MDNGKFLEEEYLKDPQRLTSFRDYVNYFRERGLFDKADEVRLNYYESFALPEDMYIDWLNDSFTGNRAIYDLILGISLKDYPHSVKIHHIKIQNSPNKLQSIQESISFIGEFDNYIWDMYRNIDLNNKKRIFAQQLHLPVPEWETIYGEYKLEYFEDAEKIELSMENQKVLDLIKLHQSKFHQQSTALMLTKEIPQKMMFERCLIHHPRLSSLWIRYINAFPNDFTLPARAVRFCPDSGRIWALRSSLSKSIDYTGFCFLKSANDSNLLLSQLIALSPDSTETIINTAMQYPVVSQGDSWVFPTILLDEYFRKKGFHEKRYDVLRSATKRNSQRSDLWLRLINFEKSLPNNDERIRDTFQEAYHKLHINQELILQEWMSFEAIRGSLSNISSLIDNNKSVKVEDETDAEVFGKRTIFVGGTNRDISENDLYKMFKAVGKIKGIRMKKGFAFIEYHNETDAEAAIKSLNGESIKGAILDVKPHEKPNAFTLYIKYNADAETNDLISFIKEKSGVSKMIFRLAKTSSQEAKETGSLMKGYGFFDIEKESDALRVLSLNGTLFMHKALKIEVAKQKPKEAHQSKKKQTIDDVKQKRDEKEDTLRAFFGVNK